MDDLLHNGGFRLDAGPSNEQFDDREEVEPVVEQVDEPICRVCRSGREDGPLFHPCKCTGSIRHALKVIPHALSTYVKGTGTFTSNA